MADVSQGKPRCPVHGVELEMIVTSFHSERLGVTVDDVEALRCPVDGEVSFSVEAYAEVRRRLAGLVKPVVLVRQVSTSGRRPTLNLPEDVVRQLGIRVGDPVRITVEGPRMIVQKVVSDEEAPP